MLFSHPAHAQSAVNSINNLTFACWYQDCFRYLTGGKMIKYVLHYLLFLTLSKNAEIVQGPCGSFWGGNPKHSSFGAQRAAPMTHLYWRRGFILFWGKQDLRSQHLLSSLALWVLEARHITTVWLKIYTLSDMFSLIFSKPYLPRFAESCLRWRSGSCLNCFATNFKHLECQTTKVWIFNKCILFDWVNMQ